MGTVVRAGTAKVLEYSKMYQCKKCKAIVHVEAPPSRYHAFPKFAECPNQCIKGKVVAMTNPNSKCPIYSKFRDFQELKLQEQVHKMDVGSMPKAISCILDEDLVNSCKPGDDVAIT
jgi:DNA helicase MCM9